MFDKLDGFGVKYENDYKLLKNLAIIDFESICVPSYKLKATNTTTWTGNAEPISVSISFNLIKEPNFLSNKDPKTLIVFFVAALEELAGTKEEKYWKHFTPLKCN